MRSWGEMIRARSWTVVVFSLGTAALLIGLPMAVWLDLREVSDGMLRREAARDPPDHQRHQRILRARDRGQAAPTVSMG